MKVLVIGAGAREHALCWKLKQSPLVTELYVAPGNPGMDPLARLVPIEVSDPAGLCNFAVSNKIDLTVVGPEYPLSLGIVDTFEAQDLRIFGPSREAARLESSKSFCKEILISAGVFTAASRVFNNQADLRRYLVSTSFPLVLKADGLAAGKGVFVCSRREEALAALECGLGASSGSLVVVEDFLSGVEASFIVATDGDRAVPLATSHDYKRVGEGDTGPNTGGMGSVSPTPRLSADMEKRIMKEIIDPVLAEMRKRGTPFRGFLYAGLMIDDRDRIWVLEFNARLGDPETQSIMRRLESDLLPLLLELSSKPEKRVTPPELKWSSQSAVTVVMAAHGYPEKPRTGDVITGIEAARELHGVEVFHAGTALSSSRELRTAGGRVLSVTAIGSSVREARERAQKGCALIQFSGAQLRKDIGNE